MPRKPAVPHEEMAKAIMREKHSIIDRGSICGPTADVWQQVARSLNNLVTPRYVYQYVKQDRHNILEVLGLTQFCAPSSPAFSTSPYSEMDIALDEYEEGEQVVQAEKTFVISFNPEEWRTIKPIAYIYKRKDRVAVRNRMVLPPNCWANKIIEKLWEGHKIPCPYSIARGHVTSGEDTEYIRIAAKCKECGATATGVILVKPIEGESVSLSWRAPDTRNVPHQRSRFLSGPERTHVGNQLKRNCASAYRRELAFLKMEQGDVKPPTLWSTSVLRKAKQETLEKGLGTQGHSSPIDSLVNLKHSARYAGIIHDIGVDKFFIHYYSAAQLLLYKKHQRANYTKLSIDATGTLVKKIHYKETQHTSGHIFLYESVLTSVPKSGSPQSLPVTQMMSEKHDTNSIVYWLNEWRRAGAPVPNEIVVDNSAALKSAVARVFAGSDIRRYIDDSFCHVLEGKDGLPKPFIRLDVAHYVKAACRWAIWRDRSRKRVKEFYIRCLGVLINAQTLDEFKERLRDILSLAKSPYQADSSGNAFPVSECLSRLCMVMKNGSTDTDMEIDDEETDVDAAEQGQRLADSGIVEPGPKLNKWISDINNDIVTPDDPEGQLNPYYLPEVAKEFCRISSEFVLWSSVLVTNFGTPFMRGTSSPVESSFSDLKCNILKGVSRPLKVDNFVATHIQAIEGACRIAGMTSESKNMCSLEIENQKIPDDADDLNAVENWRGLGVPKRSKYLSAFPGAEVVLTSGNTGNHKPGLLKNGSGMPITASDGTVLCIANTCPFDALCHLVANAYMTFKSYRDLMSDSVNGLIKTAVTLAQNGATKDTYTLRAETLASVLEPKAQLRMPETRRRSLALEYDAYGNVGNLLKKLIPPHMSQEVTCEIDNHSQKKMLIDPNSKTLCDLGLGGLNESLLNCRLPCSFCDNIFGGHIFVDVEFLSDESFPRNECCKARKYALSELPKQLSLGNDTYSLAGVVAYADHHYVAYCFSVSAWRKCDDLLKREMTVDETAIIWPSIVMYVK